MTSLLTRLLRRHPRTDHLTFTVYSRAQCCCCHKALDVLQDAQRRFGFALEEVDIDRDPDLVLKFDTEVPVVAVNGKVRFRGVVNPALLERLLLAESRDRPDTPGASVTSE
jgi:glutaredoxin